VIVREPSFNKGTHMDQVLTLYPEDIVFADVRINHVYIQTVEITNNLQNAVSFRIRLV
jgi:hypothetical protein